MNVSCTVVSHKHLRELVSLCNVLDLCIQCAQSVLVQFRDGERSVVHSSSM